AGARARCGRAGVRGAAAGGARARGEWRRGAAARSGARAGAAHITRRTRRGAMSGPRVTVFDYGAGNLHSLVKALEASGAVVRVETDPTRTVEDTDALVLPGVGAFGAAAERLAPGREVVREALERGLPALGICLGMQLLFDASDEGPGDGLGIIPGRVTRLHAARVPQIGWNAIEGARDPLFDAS